MPRITKNSIHASNFIYYGVELLNNPSTMKKSSTTIKTSEDYVLFVEQFTNLLDQELSKWENLLRNQENLKKVIHAMPALISLINTVGYLRGQDGMFDFRPLTIANQKDFYAYEDAFEKRLNDIIDVILASDEKEYYKQLLDSYFTKVRSKQMPTVW